MNIIWGIMIIGGIVYAALTGRMSDISDGIMNSMKDAVSLSITMLGIMSFWSGIMEIAADSGIIKSMTKKMSVIINFFFPNIPKENKAREYISSNFIANMCGLSWAATASGLSAMRELKKMQNPNEVRASDEMCTFLVLNISSLQLIPINIIAYRSQYGSVNPWGIILPGLIATTASTLAAAIFCRIRCRKQ
ncbi:nucleoside recognition protein [Falcatimonas sp. MSJ-15]|uniref:nucleoside recognition protein n=1 Tax=Falcatimonas sp. MSJ-15 TaxID=2841515 RepID=UPI0035301C2C